MLPCALVLLGIVLLLGPSLGHALFEPTGANTIWPHFYSSHEVLPEPTEHARYLLSLLGPVLAVGGILSLRNRSVRDAVPPAATLLAQFVLVAFVIACVIAQREHQYLISNAAERQVFRTAYFTSATLVIAVSLALLAAAALRRSAFVARLADATRESPGRRALAAVVAALVTLAYLLSAYNTEATIRQANAAIAGHTGFWIDEAAPVLNGQAPLVDFHAQYGHLWAYIAGGGMWLFGSSLGVYAAIMLAGTAATMTSVYATLRRVISGSSLLTLALFLPFLATSFFMKIGPPDNRYSPAGLFSLFPIRYAGPYLLLWLLVVRVDAGARRRPLALLTLACLVVINNPEFGVPALCATLACLVWALPARSPRLLARLAIDALAGTAIAIGLVSALTLAVGGSLPHFGMLLTFPRIFGIEGYGLLPMPAVGFHLVVYVTFVAAIVVASVRTLSNERDTLTAALGWVGIFGLGIGAYFTGRSHPQVLIDVLSAWALALALLAVVTVRAVLRRPSRRPLLAELLVLAGFGVMVCSLAQIPTPWSQIDRLRHGQPRSAQVLLEVERTVDELTRPGETVALLMRTGHRMAEDIGIVDVAPYANIDSMLTKQQWSETIAALEHAHGRKLITSTKSLFEEQVVWLAAHGYTPYVEVSDLHLIGFTKRS